MNDFPNLPKSWQIKTLKEIMSVKDGTHESPKYLSKGYPFVTSKNLKNNTISFDNIKYISKQDYDKFNERSRVEIGDVLFAMIGTIGNPVVITQEVNFAIKNVALFKKSNFVLPMFLKYYLETSFVINKMQKESRGSTQKFVSLEYLRNFKIPIPPLEIQRHIVKRLDEAFVRIESGTKHLKSAKDNLTKYKQSLLKSAFNGTLTNDSPISQGESTAESSLRGSNATEAIHKIKIDCHESANADSRNDDKDSLNGESANLPQGWTIKTLGEIGEIITGTTPNTKNKEYYGDEYPFYKPTDLNSGYFVENSSDMVSSKGFEISRKLPPKSILVTCIGATIGKTGFIRNAGICNQQINAIIAKQSICPEFVYFYCISNKMQELIKTNASATTLPILNKTAFSKLPIPIPPLEIQRQIVAILEKHFTSADKVSAYIDSCLTKAKQLKSSLLKSAFAGELV